MRRSALAWWAVPVAIVALLVAGQLIANARADAQSAGLDPAVRDEVTVAGHDFWDNPFQRIAFRAYGVRVMDGPAPDDCATAETADAYEVTAYTLFGIPLDTVTVTCAGIGHVSD